MKKIKITNTNKYMLVDDEDFEWFNQFSIILRGGGYAARLFYINGKQKTLLIHREIMNAERNQLVDHKNQNKLDNRKSNLRFCSRSTNAMNCKVHKHNTSGYKGVSYMKSIKKYRAYIVLKDKQINLGCYSNKTDAAKAYDKKALELFGEFASLNFKANK